VKDHAADVSIGLLKSVPSVGAILIWASGLTIGKGVALMGGAFIALQAAYLLWRWRREARRDRD